MKNEIHKIKTLEMGKTKIRENRNRKRKIEMKEIGNRKRNEENKKRKRENQKSKRFSLQ